jgi:vacuolar-type H+-ATPase subunit H
MYELYEDWLVSPMTPAELAELSEDEKADRRSLQIRNSYRKYVENNREKLKESRRKYVENNREKLKESRRKFRKENQEKIKQYKQSPAGKKSNTISLWKRRGLQESPEDLDRIYELYLHQELCNACDIKLTRTGKLISTDASMDHNHNTHRFRHIICRACNNKDSWMKHFC